MIELNKNKIAVFLSLYNIEIWRDVKRFEEYYQVSNLGRVKSKRSDKIMKPNKVGRGYYKVDFKIKGERHPQYIHRLVLENFTSELSYNETVNHINENKIDNRLCNLEWLSDYDNNRYGSHDKKRRKEVLGINIENGYIVNFNSVTQAEEYGFDSSCVSECSKNKYGKLKNIYKKYYWI